jgi:hypothetical protein
MSGHQAVSGPPCPPPLSTIQHGPNRRCRKNFKTPLLDRPVGSAQEIATPRVRVRKRTLHLAGLPRGWTGWGSRDQKQAPWLGGFLHHTDWARSILSPLADWPARSLLKAVCSSAVIPPPVVGLASFLMPPSMDHALSDLQRCSWPCEPMAMVAFHIFRPRRAHPPPLVESSAIPGVC